jgi:alpha-pyrone synthase
VDHLQLDPNIDRTMVGFMGCYAAINGLKLARHIVRSEPQSSVLMINLELCTLHFQETEDIEKILSFLLFGDGCAASLIRSGNRGISLDSFQPLTIPEARDLIQWRIGDQGFDMDLSGKVPTMLRKALHEKAEMLNLDPSIDLWAVHPGGRSVLDAVEAGLSLDPKKLEASRSILHDFGNMSSATIMFVLERLIRTAQSGQNGCAMSFGPGLTAETMSFHVC